MNTTENKTKHPEDDIPKSPKEFHLEMPLYKEIIVTKENSDAIHILLDFDGTIDAYCVYCRKESVFENFDRPGINFLIPREGEHVSTSYICTRDSKHKYTSYFRIGKRTITKIGQDPSVADFQIPQVQKYRKLLNKEKHDEFTRAIGLAAHGVGIGSFVYLRRIFEGLIEEAHTKASQEEEFNNREYSSSKIEKKILLLKNYLPSFLVESRSMYEVLSKGIHELTEQECLAYFDPLKVGIELILDEQMRERDRIEKENQARTSISKITGKLRKE